MIQDRKLLYNLALLMFISSIGVGIILPIMPALFIDEKFGLVLPGKFLFFSRETVYGICFAMFPIGNILGSAILGSLSDQFGRRNLLLLGVGCMALTYLISMVSILLHFVRLFVLSRMLTGIFAGVSAVASAMVSDISTSADHRISNIKVLCGASLLGMIIGPGISTFFSIVTFIDPLSIPFMAAFILSAGNFLMLYFVTKYTIGFTSNTDNKFTYCFSRYLQIKNLIYNNLVLIFNNTKDVFVGQQTRYLSFTFFFFKFSNF